ncbi:hypothetical protein SDC9_102001 [bioreactor metagenome]|uniref:Uncharacterized protein n=1 Tax=bioreactor metagenome TaxID=1076179 RepID=A0A645AR06_9ZZZZ
MGIFEKLDNIEIKKLVEELVKKVPIAEEYSSIKTMAIKAAIDLDEKKKNDKKIKENKEVKKPTHGLVVLYELAKKNKKHPYDILKKEGYIKNPIDEFLTIS